MFHISTESSLRVEKSSMTNVNTLFSGGVLFCLSSEAWFIECTISNIDAQKEGGFALVNQDSYISISRSTSITGVSALSYSIIAGYDTKVELSDSTFRDFNNTGIFGNALAGLTINNCEFTNSMAD